MANPEHLAELRKGVRSWNQWRKEFPDFRPDLHQADLKGSKFRGADLSGANLSASNFSDADLSDADLREVDLSGAILPRANLIGANLIGANLTGAELTWATLTHANLARANLTAADCSLATLSQANCLAAIFGRANLSEANLNQTNLREARFTGANLSGAKLPKADLSDIILNWTTFANIDLSQSKGLETCNHQGPSTIGIDTIYRSQGQIPDVFLRGCGVPEQFITYARSLVGQAIEFYSCFISYSSQDQEFSERLHADLRAKKLRVWFAPEDLKIGERFQERIEESIRLYDRVMIVLSEASVKSRWVEREVNAAREREDRENRVVLFPIQIDDAIMDAPQPWTADIRRSRHIGDFRRWKDHDSYQKAFERLLRDLRADVTSHS